MVQRLCVDPYGYVRHLEGQFSVAENARRLKHYRWLEAQMMDFHGGWIATMGPEKIKTGLAVPTFEDADHPHKLGKPLPAPPPPPPHPPPPPPPPSPSP